MLKRINKIYFVLKRLAYHLLKIVLYPNQSRISEAARLFEELIHRRILSELCIEESTNNLEQNKTTILWIDPKKVKKDSRSLNGIKIKNAGYIVDGCWDKRTRNFENRWKIKSLKTHFNSGISWEETVYFKRINLWLKMGGKWRGCEQSSDLKSYLKKYDELYCELNSEGYKSQSELRPNATTPEHNEIGITISRSNEFAWYDCGQHRLYLAQLAGINKVPVRVVAVHRMNEIYNSDF